MSHVVRRRLAAATAVALLLPVTAACGSNDGDDSATETTTITGLKVEGDFGQAPTVEVLDDFDVSKPETATPIVGDGPKIAEGDTALFHLYVYNATAKKEAFSTYPTGPEETQVTAQALPGGLAEEVIGQTRGTRVVYAADVEEVFGTQIPTDAGLSAGDDVVFVTDVMSVHPTDVLDGPKGEEQPAEEGLPTVVADDDNNVTGLDYANAAETPSDELQVVTLIEGDGPAIPDRPVYVTFDYYGEVYGAKKPFDESFSKDPATFAVGKGSLIKAWDQGLVGVKAGSRVLMIVPPELGYGEQGSGADIPPNSTLVFVIDVLGVDA